MAKAASGSQAGQVVPRGAGSRQAAGPPTGSQGALRRRTSESNCWVAKDRLSSPELTDDFAMPVLLNCSQMQLPAEEVVAEGSGKG